MIPRNNHWGQQFLSLGFFYFFLWSICSTISFYLMIACYVNNTLLLVQVYKNIEAEIPTKIRATKKKLRMKLYFTIQNTKNLISQTTYLLKL